MTCTLHGGFNPTGSRVLRSIAQFSLLAAGLGLSACTGGLGLLGGGSKQAAPETIVNESQVSDINNGGGGVKVALLLPTSARGQAGDIAKGLKQAGELALFDTNNPGIVLIQKDTRGTPGGAQAAAKEAIAEGAELILGPLFAGSVKAVAPVASAANVPVMAFSTDQTVAGNGVYLLSFLPSQEVKRVVEYAAERGARNFGAIVPTSPYGTLVEKAMVTAVPRRGGKIVATARYGRAASGLAAPVKQMSTAVKESGVDAVMVAEGGSLLRTMGPALQQAGVGKPGVQLIGTGLWDEQGIGSVAGLTGGWFAGPAPGPKSSFERRFKSAYGRQPPRIASLSYDAVSLSVALSRGAAGDRFSVSKLTNPEGFAGVDGLFRFLPNGLNQRGLAVIEVTASGSRVISPPPSRFSGAGY